MEWTPASVRATRGAVPRGSASPVGPPSYGRGVDVNPREQTTFARYHEQIRGLLQEYVAVGAARQAAEATSIANNLTPPSQPPLPVPAPSWGGPEGPGPLPPGAQSPGPAPAFGWRGPPPLATAPLTPGLARMAERDILGSAVALHRDGGAASTRTTISAPGGAAASGVDTSLHPHLLPGPVEESRDSPPPTPPSPLPSVASSVPPPES